MQIVFCRELLLHDESFNVFQKDVPSWTDNSPLVALIYCHVPVRNCRNLFQFEPVYKQSTLQDLSPNAYLKI